MRVSQRYRLGRTQYELDFVDIDTARDTRLFLDPYFLGTRTDRFSLDAARTLQSFFEHFIALMQAGQVDDARALFNHLREPNETCLGLSRGRPQGAGIGDEQAQQIFDSIRNSRAIQTGMIEHIEDVRLFVPNIGKDKVSDMTTNIIRKHLMAYTKEQCALWRIPRTPNVQSGYYWDIATRAWVNELGDALVIGGRRILLVPKGIVSYAKAYTPERYHRHFVLEFLQHEHLIMQTALVQRKRLKNGEVKEWVTKVSVENHEAPLDKDYLARFTQTHLQVFQDFKESQKAVAKSLTNEDLDSRTDLRDVIDHLEEALRATPPGNERATDYHRTAAAILELIFYPRLIYPQMEREVDQGRKRIDLILDNAASTGFFHRLSNHHQIICPYVMVECKNYSRDVANPEIDQLIGRFHVNRGRFGLLICRSAENSELILQRCRDAYNAGNGVIIPLYDEDLVAMLEELRMQHAAPGEALLTDRLRRIALGA